MTTKTLPLMVAAGSVLLSLAATAPAGAAEITVFRGSEATVVNTNAPHKGPHVLRGGMGPKVASKAPAETTTVVIAPMQAGSGGTVWYQTDDGLQACWLRGTGYVGQRRVHCTDR